MPLYDSIGNLVALTDLDGEVFERTRYSPYGLGSLRVDSTAPNLEQILFRNGAFRLGFSEEVELHGVQATIDEHGIRVEVFDPNQPQQPPQDLGPLVLTPLQIELCSVELGCGPAGGNSTASPLASLAGAAVTRDISSNLRSAGASRWVTLSLVNPPADGTHVRLTIAAGAFEDLFQNRSTQEVVRELTWGTQETVLLDDTPPRVRSVRLSEGHLEIELTEEADLATAQAAIDVGQPATWALSADGLTLRTEAPLLAGGFALTVQPSLADQAGLLLQQLFELSLQIPAIEPNAVFFEEPDPQETQSSSVGNVYGFHGLPRDPETGLIYARNRYYDPEMGRFVTADPLGYVDGPSMYGFAGYDPANQSDPSGLICHECTMEATKKYEAERRRRERWYNSQTFKGAIVLAQQMEAAGVSDGDAQVALSNFFRLRGVSFQDRVPLIRVLTGTGQSGVNQVLSELGGIHVWADFFESYLLNYPLAITGAEVALGARAMIIAIRQVGVRAAMRELGAAFRPVAWRSEANVGLERASAEWQGLAGGVRIKGIGNYWVKEVDPKASRVAQWWGRGSLEAQAKALERLEDLAPAHLYRNGRMVTRDVGLSTLNYGSPEFWRIWLQGSIRLRTPMNDIRVRNIGANGQIFDPALHPVQEGLYWLGGSALGGYAAYELGTD